MVNPPKQGDDSYDQFAAKEKAIFDSLVRCSKSLVEGLNKIKGVQFQPAQGAMHAFLSISIETGICVVPASGFGQKEGRIGFRTNFLPPEDQLEMAVDGSAEHHKIFCDMYN